MSTDRFSNRKQKEYAQRVTQFPNGKNKMEVVDKYQNAREDLLKAGQRLKKKNPVEQPEANCFLMDSSEPLARYPTSHTIKRISRVPFFGHGLETAQHTLQTVAPTINRCHSRKKIRQNAFSDCAESSP